MSAAAEVLIVEDDGNLARLLVDEVESAGHGARVARSVAEARSQVERHEPDLILSDLRLPGEEGTALLDWVRRRPAPPAFIVITAFGTVRQAVACLKAGADDFLTKPLDLDHLRVTVERALERRRLREEVRRFRKVLGDDHFHGMLGRSPQFRRLTEDVRRVARGVGAVLVTGESGVGKELVARAVHEESERRGGPFLAVNCAGIPEHLLESEFFGHEEGAFTGATSSRRGLFREADGGSLLLDEIGEMPADLQAKLLRVLQDERVRPVGGSHEFGVDVRILASTNQDLKDAMEGGRFRKDLYFRLQTFHIPVPPLREREGDLELLVGHFVNRVATRLGRESPHLSPAVVERLQSHRFPGNIRELENVVERAVTFCDGPVVRLEHLPDSLRAPGASVIRPRNAPDGEQASSPGEPWWDQGEIVPLREVEGRYIRWVLEKVGGNKRRAAALLGIGRRTLYRRLEELAGEEHGRSEAPGSD